jgi:hypothetical protein
LPPPQRIAIVANMTDSETLLRQVKKRQAMFTEEDEVKLREIAAILGGFIVIRRPDLQPINAAGKQLTQIEVRYRGEPTA